MKGVVVCICVAKERSATHIKTLEDLYYENINPHERYIKRGSKADELVKVICKNEEKLTSTFIEQQKETFEKFKACYAEMASITEREVFSDGFIIALRDFHPVCFPFSLPFSSFLFCPFFHCSTLIRKYKKCASFFLTYTLYFTVSFDGWL